MDRNGANNFTVFRGEGHLQHAHGFGSIWASLTARESEEQTVTYIAAEIFLPIRIAERQTCFV